MTVTTEIQKSRWTGERIARLGFLLGLGWDAKPRRYWPRTITEWADQMAHAELEESERRARQQISNRAIIRPTAAEIAQMEAAFEWLRELRAVYAGMAVVTTQLRTARRRSIKASGICQLTDSPPASHKRTNHMARGIQKHVIRREAVLSQNPNWRSRRLPRIAIGARATDKLTARLLSLEFLDRHSIITPREADELESLQCWRSTLKS